MIVELSESEIETILTSFKYSKLRIEDLQNIPCDIRQERLDRINEVAGKLQQAKK